MDQETGPLIHIQRGKGRDNAELCVRSTTYSIAVLSVLMGLNAPATEDDLSATATAGVVANKQKVIQMFPQHAAIP
jgi:hypothetical protein